MWPFIIGIWFVCCGDTVYIVGFVYIMSHYICACKIILKHRRLSWTKKKRGHTEVIEGFLIFILTRDKN